MQPFALIAVTRQLENSKKIVMVQNKLTFITFKYDGAATKTQPVARVSLRVLLWTPGNNKHTWAPLWFLVGLRLRAFDTQPPSEQGYQKRDLHLRGFSKPVKTCPVLRTPLVIAHSWDHRRSWTWYMFLWWRKLYYFINQGCKCIIPSFWRVNFTCIFCRTN